MRDLSWPKPLREVSKRNNVDQKTKAVSPVIVVLDLPAALLVEGLAVTRDGLVADNVDLVAVRADELLKDTADDGRHAGGDNDGRDVVGQGPLEVLVEVGVEGDVLDQVIDTLREGAGDRVHHLAESISVRNKLHLLRAYVALKRVAVYLKFFLPSRTSLLPCLRFSAP